MKEMIYEFVELESDQSFQLLAKAFQRNLQDETLNFNNPVVQGQVIQKSPEEGLWIRKWRLTMFRKITLHWPAAPVGREQKFSLVYFLNPSIFQLKVGTKQVQLNTRRNNIFLSKDTVMAFSVVPKQPFYVLDLTFTLQWLLNQFTDSDNGCKEKLELYLKTRKAVFAEPCNENEYRILYELDTFLQPGKEDVLFTRSRTYQLICSFLGKAFLKERTLKQSRKIYNYEQMVQAEAMLMKQLQKSPTVEDIAKGINMSTASLLRQFKSMYGKSLHKYYVEKKMEMAGRMLKEKHITVKKLAENLGYKQASHFIATFTKHFGYSPGSLKIY